MRMAANDHMVVHRPIDSKTEQVQRDAPSEEENDENRYAFAMNEF